MTAAADTWDAYAHLLARLIPRTSHILFTGPDGATWWSSDPDNRSRIEYAVSLLLADPGTRYKEIDGILETADSSESRYGFRIRGVLGELLGLVVIAVPQPQARLELAAVHCLIRPALDCLQSELAARAALKASEQRHGLGVLQHLTEAASADGMEALAQIPAYANEHLGGAVAAILLPKRNLTICRKRAGQPSGIESGMLGQMHRHLLTRVQLHGCTLVTNRLVLDGGGDTSYKAIATPIRDEARRVAGVLAVLRSDTDRDFQLQDAEAVELLANKAAQIIGLSFDALTGVPTLASFKAQAAARLASAGQPSNHVLLYIDIDQLNVINENHGMPVGDEIIQGVANLLARRARESTLVTRIGGDRFCLLVWGCGIEPAARIAEELRGAAIRLSGARGDKPLAVSLSIGVSRLGDGGRSLDHAVAAAELACRTAKERGRNRVEVFYGGERRREDEPALPPDHSFELLAQVVLPLRPAPADPRFEMLLRVRAPDGTRVSTEKLLRSYASPQQVRAIDRWVVEHTIERLAENRLRLREHPAKFSVNLAAASLIDAQFWGMVETLARNSRIEPGTLGFEFPEEAASANLEAIVPFMRRLREQGISFSLDNFGRGLGSLAHLNRLPVGSVKIDGSLCRDLADNRQAQSMVAAIAQLAANFGLETVACHVETDLIRARASQLGVDYGQGFFIGKPLHLDEAMHDLPLYAGFATSTGLVDPSVARAATLRR